MRWLDKLERRFGFIAIPNFVSVIITGEILALFISMQYAGMPAQLALDPERVQAGEWWRLFTWILVPSLDRLSLILAIFWYLLLYTMGRTLEQEWGSFRSTLYFTLGILAPAAGSMLLWLGFGIPTYFTGFYFVVTLQLAFAALVPEYTVMLMFILPVKMRWVAWATGAYLLFRAFTGGPFAFVEILFGTANYLLFFLPGGIQAWKNQQASHAAMGVFREAKREAERAPVRTCVVCGRGVDADLRLCHCERCGEDGRNYCVDDLQEHLAVPEKQGSRAPAKKKRKS